MLAEFIKNFANHFGNDYVFKDEEYEKIANELMHSDDMILFEGAIMRKLEHTLAMICASHFVNFMPDGSTCTYLSSEDKFEFYSTLTKDKFKMTPTEVILEMRNDLYDYDYQDLTKDNSKLHLVKEEK